MSFSLYYPFSLWFCHKFTRAFQVSYLLFNTVCFLWVLNFPANLSLCVLENWTDSFCSEWYVTYLFPFPLEFLHYINIILSIHSIHCRTTSLWPPVTSSSLWKCSIVHFYIGILILHWDSTHFISNEILLFLNILLSFCKSGFAIRTTLSSLRVITNYFYVYGWIKWDVLKLILMSTMYERKIKLFLRRTIPNVSTIWFCDLFNVIKNDSCR